MHKVSIGLRDLSKLEIVHRDLHLSNIVLHFPSLEPTAEEMEDIYTYMDTLSKRRHDILNRLGDDDFDDF